MEVFVDRGDAGVVLLEDREELGVASMINCLRDEAEENGDLELDLTSVDTVEDTVKLGVAEGEDESVNVVGFRNEGGGARGDFFSIEAGEVTGELPGGTGESVS